MLFQILKIILIIDFISLIGLILLLHREIIETIKEQRTIKQKNKKEQESLRKRMKLNEYGGWNYDE